MVQPASRKQMSESRLAMWRSLIALAYADGTLKDTEKKMLTDYLKANYLTPEQHALLQKDIQNGVTLSGVYSGVTDIRDRAHLLNMASVMFHTDRDFSAAEQKAYDAIYRDQKSAVDFDKVRQSASKEIGAYRQNLNAEEHAVESGEGRIERVMDFISGVDNLFD